MFNSHFKYLFSSHHRDTYQIISYKDIPNLFHCPVTNCLVADPLSNHKRLDSPGWALRSPSRPVQPLPDVSSLSQMLLIFCRMAIRVQNCLPHKRSFFCFQQNREHSPSEAAPSEGAAQHPPPAGTHTGKGSGSRFMLYMEKISSPITELHNFHRRLQALKQEILMAKTRF